jgi:uncharacterized repeat protein (TIGR01451 family)
LVKTASESTGHPKDIVTYSLAYSNMGSGSVFNVTLTDILPVAGAESYVAGSASNGGVYNAATNSLSWTFTSLSAGGSGILTYQVQLGLFAAQYNPVVNLAQLAYPGGQVSASQSLTVTGNYVVHVDVYNSAGELVKTLSQFESSIPLPGFDLTGSVIQTPQDVATLAYGGVTLTSWDATNSSGKKVSNGTYYIKVESTDPFGVTTTVTQDVTVNLAQSSLSLMIFNGAGEVVKSLDTEQIEALLGGVALSSKDYGMGGAKISSTALSPSYGQPGAAGSSVTITLGSGGSFTWDGQGDDGQMLKPGTYFLELKSIQPNTASQETTWDIVVLPASGSAGGKTLLEPNPINLNQTQTAKFKINEISPLVDNVEIQLYTLAGELMKIRLANDAGNVSQVSWNLAGLNVASGMYIGVVELKSGDHLIARQTLKIAILR